MSEADAMKRAKAYRSYCGRLFLEPVGAEWDGTSKPLDMLSYKAYDGHALKADEPIQIERQGNSDERPNPGERA